MECNISSTECTQFIHTCEKQDLLHWQSMPASLITFKTQLWAISAGRHIWSTQKESMPHLRHHEPLHCTSSAHCASFSCWFMLQQHLLLLQHVQIHLTLFAKSFSHFPQGTCSLSASNRYSALDESYHQLCIPLPRNTILRHMPKRKHFTTQTGISPFALHCTTLLPCEPSSAMLLACKSRRRVQAAIWTHSNSFAITTKILVSASSSTYWYA